MPSKKFAKLAVLSLLGVLSLASCSSDESSDEIIAKPSTYWNPIVQIEDGEGKSHGLDIWNNIQKIVYDAMREGDLKSEVMKKVMYMYAESIYGSYDAYTAKDYGNDYITLKAAVEDAKTSTHTEADKFIRAHRVYWRKDADGKHIDDQGNPVNDSLPNWEVSNFERETLIAKYDGIELRIKEAMYNKATTSAQTANHYFDEYEFVKSLHKDAKSVDWDAANKYVPNDANDPSAGTHPYIKDKLVLVDYMLEKEDVFVDTTLVPDDPDDPDGPKHQKNPNGLLHRELYQNDAKGITYIQDEILEGVYGDLLIEQYLLDEEIAVVRDSRARRINVLKIEKYDGFSNNADALKDDLLNQIYHAADVVPTVASGLRTDVEKINDYYTELFEAYATVNKGMYNEISQAPLGSLVADIMSRISTDTDIYEKNESGDYYNHTSYGDLMEEYGKYEEMLDPANEKDFDKTLYNKFTDEGKISSEEGLRRKVTDLDQNQTITKGWYVQNSQPTLDGSGKINSRLFTMTVANEKMEIGDLEPNSVSSENYERMARLDRFQLNEAGDAYELRDELSSEESKYLCSINGAYFLKFDNKSESDYQKYPYGGDIILEDDNAYYVVLVLEAVKDSKLRSKGDASYASSRGTDILTNIIDEVCKKSAETGSYASLSKEYWLKKMKLYYHDDAVMSYFFDNYPNTFN